MHYASHSYALGVDKRYTLCIMPDMLTSEEIKKARLDLGETQAAFASRFGVNQATVHRWENGRIPDKGAAPMAIEKFLESLKGQQEAVAS